MFRLIVRYLGFLKHVPLLAWLLDAWFMIFNSVFNPDIVRCIESIEDELSSWPGISRTVHRFGGLQFNYAAKEIGHIHSNGLLDILFNTQTKRKLLQAGIASDHHVFPQSGWISFHIRSRKDVQNALWLLRLSYEAAREKERSVKGLSPFTQ